MPLTEDDATRIGNIILGVLCNKLSIPQIRLAVARAGLDAGRIPGFDSRAAVVPAVYNLFREMMVWEKLTALPILAESVAGEEITRLLRRHGFQFVDGEFIPVAMLDERELKYLPASSAEQISKAFERLLDGDENGAVTSACGAVDTATIAIYEKYGLGQPPDSFQAKVNTVLKKLDIYQEMKGDLTEVGIQPNDSEQIASELAEATKHAANALQLIRRLLGDVHGKKPSYTRLTYDAIKWASAICGLLEGKI
jgi:hypothetical protein